MAQLMTVAGTNRDTLYEKCLWCFATKLNYNQQTLNNVQQLRYLPPGVLIDIYVLVSLPSDKAKGSMNKFILCANPFTAH